MIKRHATTVTLLIGAILAAPMVGAVPKEPDVQAQSATLTLIPFREWPGRYLASDLAAVVGESFTEFGFGLECTGDAVIHFTVTHNNPQFAIADSPREMQCGTWEALWVTFTPVAAGFTIDNVEVTSELGVARVDLIGNGYPIQQPDLWTASLGNGNAAQALIYDAQRDRLYVTDKPNGRVVVVNPHTHAVETVISVGAKPIGLAQSPDGARLYVANSGDNTISVVDATSQIEQDRIPLPALGPEPGFGPYSIAVMGPTLALISSTPPGWASGETIYALNLVTHAVTPRPDIGKGARSIIRTSLDRSAAVVLLEPGSSPTYLARYDPTTDSAIRIAYGLERTTAISADGRQVLTANNDCGVTVPNLLVRDETLAITGQIQLWGCQTTALDFSPAFPYLLYGFDMYPYSSPFKNLVDEVDMRALRQTRAIELVLPNGYYPLQNGLVVSPDGQWLYGIAGQTWNAPPSLVFGLPLSVTDVTAPVTAMDALAPFQAHTYWPVSWHGTDPDGTLHHFAVQYRRGPTGAWTNWLTTTVTRALFIADTPGEVYSFRVRGVDSEGNTEAFSEGEFATTVAGTDVTGPSRMYLTELNR